MKIKSNGNVKASPDRHSGLPPGGRRRTFIRSILFLVAGIVLGAFITLAAFPKGLSFSLIKFVSNHALFVYPPDRILRSEILDIPRRLLRRPDLPQLVLDVKFKHLMRLYAARDQALAQGVLIQEEDSLVPATARIGDKTVRVKVRLKGDWVDHLDGKKWSFRVHVKGEDEIFGLRRFSIQHPKTRGYQGEPLFMETLRRYGILAPRYFFATVHVNGKNLGIMAIEEHFSKELLEHNNRKESVIVKFDETQMFKSSINNEQTYSPLYARYETTPIDAFRSSRIARSPFLSGQYSVAVGLLRAFSDGRLPASQVFDVEKMGTFLAITQAWGASHGNVFHNMRFYLNPYTSRLEPIGFDASLHGRSVAVRDIIPDKRITKRMLEDPEIRQAYQASLNRIDSDLHSQDLMQRLTEVQDAAIKILRSEFSLLQPIDLSELTARIDAGRIGAGRIGAGPIKPDRRPPVSATSSEYYLRLIFAYFTPSKQDGATLEIGNIVPDRVAVTDVRWVSNSNSPTETAISLDFAYPILVAPTQLGAAASITSIRLPVTQDWSTGHFEITASLYGENDPQTVRAVRSSPVSEVTLPFRDSSAEQQLSTHPFLTMDRGNAVISIRPGDWRVEQTLVIPEGFRLEVVGDTVLRFANDAALIAYGSVSFGGSSAKPIRLTAQDSATWPGVVVFEAPAPSRWSHVTVEQTRGVPWVGWTLTGGVTFYESDALIDNAEFRDSRGEDALNIVNSAFELDNVNFQNTTSDAFDSDFSTGRVNSGAYSSIGLAGSGGDAIDVSGSEIVIEGTRFMGVSDKAISIGERSQARVANINILRATSGVVSKDGSDVHIERSVINGSGLAGLMAYTKKAEYGPARLVAEGVDVRDSQSPALAQNGSSIEWNGKTVPAGDIDVDALYANVKKP